MERNRKNFQSEFGVTLSYARSLTDEFGIKLPERPDMNEIVRGLIAALGEAQNQREELLEDLTPDCSICRHEWRMSDEEPCCRCEGCSEFVWRGLTDSMVESGDSDDEG